MTKRKLDELFEPEINVLHGMERENLLENLRKLQFNARAGAWQHNQAIFYFQGATLATGAKPMGIVIPKGLRNPYVYDILLYVGTAPAGGSLRVDVLNNGESVFRRQPYVEILAGQQKAWRGNEANDWSQAAALREDDVLTVFIRQGNTVAADLSVHVRVRSEMEVITP